MNIKKKVVIIGAGLSTNLFLFKLAKLNLNIHVDIFEKSSESDLYSNYDDIPFYFNQDIELLDELFKTDKITVNMGIYENDKVFHKGTNDLSDKYSLKITGKKCGNTISMIEEYKNVFKLHDDRYGGRRNSLLNMLYSINKNNNMYSFHFNSNVDEINLSKKSIISNNEIFHYKFLISTIPLNLFFELTNRHLLNLTYKPFYISVINNHEKTQYKVIYCTDFNIRFNRIAHLGSSIYIESPNKFKFDDLSIEEKKFLKLYDLKSEELKKYKVKKIIPGRFVQINEYDENLIKKHYDSNDVFLLGRMANWKFKLMEDIFCDIDKILGDLK